MALGAYLSLESGADLTYPVDTSPVIVSGQADVISSDYSYTGSGSVVLSGVAGITASEWSYTGGVYPYSSPIQSPTTVTQFIGQLGDRMWHDQDFVEANDGQWAISDLSYLGASQFLIAKNLELAVPDNMTILGFKVVISKHASASVVDKWVFLMLGNLSLTSSRAKATHWSIGTDTSVVYGGIFDNWTPYDPWTSSVINDPTFGIALKAKGLVNAGGVNAFVESMTLQLFYEDTQHQRVRMGGIADVRTNHYHYKGSGGANVGLLASAGLRATYRTLNVGHGHFGPLYSSINMGGDYAPEFYFSADGGEVSLSGIAFIRSTWWSMSADGGSLASSGEAAIRSSAYSWFASGGVVGGDPSTICLPQLRAKMLGGISMGGHYLMSTYTFIPTGGPVVSGQVQTQCSAFNWVSDGNVAFVGGTADLSFGGNSYDIHLGFTDEIVEIKYVYGSAGAGLSRRLLQRSLNADVEGFRYH